ncbi:hypothetical protein [Mesorhizobium sophorae]|uniref:hypothetical protein n=1 Tax=Mesorhizobium sophorae TaxID=1300294 RepID=UPI00117D0AEC|nr:hypothetical protein [Mesorhizobium sophorae]
MTARVLIGSRTLATRCPNREAKIETLLNSQNRDSHWIVWAIAMADNERGLSARFTADWLNTVAGHLLYISDGGWTPANPYETSDGEIDLSQPDAERLQRLIKLVVEEEARLNCLSDTKLDDLHERLLDKGRFFSKESARPDYAYWRGLPMWSAEETVALCLDKDPRRVNARSLKSFRKSPFAKNFRRVLSIVNRAIELGEIPKGIERDHLKGLCTRMAIDFPNTFENQLLPPEGSKSLDAKNTSRDKPTLDRMILVMAAEKYGYNPYAKANGQALATIVAALNAAGLKTSLSIVRRNLQDAWKGIRLQPGLKGVLKNPSSPDA